MSGWVTQRCLPQGWTERALIPGLPLNFFRTLFSESLFSVLQFPNPYDGSGSILSLLSLSQKDIDPQGQNRTTPAVFAMSSGSRACSPLILRREERRGSALQRLAEAPKLVGPSRLVPRSLAPSSHSEVLLLFTCFISKHPNSTLSIFAAQLKSWICGLGSVLSSGPLSAIMPLSYFFLNFWNSD